MLDSAYSLHLSAGPFECEMPAKVVLTTVPDLFLDKRTGPGRLFFPELGSGRGKAEKVLLIAVPNLSLHKRTRPARLSALELGAEREITAKVFLITVPGLSLDKRVEPGKLWVFKRGALRERDPGQGFVDNCTGSIS
ncbi:hypothetical protein PoB_000015700 [Plakobranchus ocellatus]|uniref:Uncharacterized protein n=1 Tax=Plakobranchus ocellatus TaxID=259542 RepID=A0AAV3XSB6_9GAST|nr:hypothetical protein PoB_000015700 [Plakobranchus ocellatus]